MPSICSLVEERLALWWMKPLTRVQTPDDAVCISLHTISQVEGINPKVPSPAMDK